MKKVFYFAILITAIVLSGCKKKSDDPAPSTTTTKTDPANPTSTATYYMVFYNGTEAVKLEQAVNGVYNGAFAGSGTPNEYYHVGGLFTFTPTPGYISYNKTNGSSLSSSEMYHSFTTGSNAYGHGSTSTPGFIIEYKDSKGVTWSSDLGAKTQTGSTFNITSKGAYVSTDTFYILTGTFNCTVYDGKGNSQTLTNGKFKTMFSHNN